MIDISDLKVMKFIKLLYLEASTGCVSSSCCSCPETKRNWWSPIPVPQVLCSETTTSYSVYFARQICVFITHITHITHFRPCSHCYGYNVPTCWSAWWNLSLHMGRNEYSRAAMWSRIRIWFSHLTHTKEYDYWIFLQKCSFTKDVP